MKAIDHYRPIELSSKSKEELHALMTMAFPILSRAATEKYGEPKIRKLRDAYKANPDSLWFDPRAAGVMKLMIGAESLVIRGYIRLASKPCAKFNKGRHDRPGVTICDYVQQCADALYDAMYMFNGRTKFTTYARWAMYKRLISFIREEEVASGIGKKIKSLRTAVRRHMRSFNCRFEDAMNFVCAEHEVSDKDMEKLRASMYRLSRIDSDNVIRLGKKQADKSEDEEMMSAVLEAPLTVMMRRLVCAHLDGDRSFRSNVSKTEINPNTKQLWTVARLSQLFMEACEIIRRHYAGKVAA